MFIGDSLEPKLLARFGALGTYPTPLESLETNLEPEKNRLRHVGMMPRLWLGRGLAGLVGETSRYRLDCKH
jgi:hypothetical protein